MNKNLLAICLSLILFPLSLISGCGDEQGNNTKDNTKIIIVGIDEFAPMGFHDEQGKIVGFDVDLAKEAAKRMGVKVEFRPIEWDNKERELESGNIDMIWNGLDITPEGKEIIIFSKPYMENRQVLLVKNGNPKNIHALGDLEGKVVGTQAGSNAEIYINEDAALKNSFAKFETYRTINEGFVALKNGKYDAIVIDEIAARYERSKHSDTFDIVEATVGSITEFGIGFSKNNTELRDKVQKAFNEMFKDGTTKKISEEWFQADLVKFGK